MAKSLVNFALELFGGPNALIKYVLEHVLGTAKGDALYTKIAPELALLEAQTGA